MEITFSFIYSQPLIITFICCALAFVAVRFSSRKSSSSSSSDLNRKCVCNGVVLKSSCSSDSMTVVTNGVVSMMEKQTGASMMEQLVPEITTHALSYLDYPSLCRLSMTNSLMRKAANDDNAWKILYHKDFTVEQDTLKPANGWKAYYAATRAIVNVNADFFNIIRERALPAMGHFWLKADYVKCIHASGEIFSGYNAVMGSWQIAFNWEQEEGNFQVRDVRARVLSDMAWVSLKTYVDMDAEPYNVTNVFEYHDGRWYMVHHHCSVMLVDGDVGQQAVHA
ncbi:F-box protein SKIP8-like [Silene latifolia]|uniref:F-box protein SKIP8-like n=1 Tax=Silene latifolia TaxID=37657 RepID=UPI003D772F2E